MSTVWLFFAYFLTGAVIQFLSGILCYFFVAGSIRVMDNAWRFLCNLAELCNEVLLFQSQQRDQIALLRNQDQKESLSLCAALHSSNSGYLLL